MKARQPDVVTALRTALGAFDNAEAVPLPDLPRVVATSEHVAGATAGHGSAEVTRRDLSIDDLRRILRAQVAECGAEAVRYESYGQSEAATRLRRQAAALSGYLPG